jgi:hypothetical protein
VQGWLQKLTAAVQLSVLGVTTVALFLISLVGSSGEDQGWRNLGGSTKPLPTCLQVPYSYVEAGTHGHLWTGAHRLFSAVEHLQLANSYGLFRRMTGVGGRPEVVLEGSYDGHHWTVSPPKGWGSRDPLQPSKLTLDLSGRRSSSCTSLGM